MFKKDRGNILGIIEAIDKITKYTANISKGEELFANSLIFDAVLMNFIVIGEMIDRISEEFKSNYPEIKWKEIKNFRNIIAHDYFGIDADEVFDIIINYIPNFKKDILKILSNILE
ncbi:MAG: HepT-like ribonuclease domain-containing protein [Candidatus Hydrogenedentota bacterium]